MFKGAMVALVTPMKSDGSIDFKALTGLVERHLDSGTQALVVNGTTGEAPTLSFEEQIQILEQVMRQVVGKIPVIAGTGTYNTAETIRSTQYVEKLGVDAAMVVTPYYNKPTQAGLYQHYKTIADSVDLPIIIYNASGRTSCELLPETTQKLSEISNIIGIKEGSGDAARCKKLRALCGPNFELYCGYDANNLSFLLAGGDGLISVAANIKPKEIAALCCALAHGKYDLSKELDSKLQPLYHALFVESNPIPVKWAMSVLGWMEAHMRLPLTPLAPQYHEQVREALEASQVVV